MKEIEQPVKDGILGYPSRLEIYLSNHVTKRTKPIEFCNKYTQINHKTMK